MYHNSLCNFARRFPREVAELLEDGISFRRSIREETITDLLMVGLKRFSDWGIRVDFPEDESQTGQDMDWEFVSPSALDGRRFLRLHIQAKRAKLNPIRSPYWWYPEIDHASSKIAKKGSQHERLVHFAQIRPGCMPLYMFYHPKSALKRAADGRPKIEGVNIMPAALIPRKVTKSAWPRQDKKVETLRPHFSSLSSLLCQMMRRPINKFDFQNNAEWKKYLNTFVPTPGEIIDDLNNRYLPQESDSDFKVEALEQIPVETLQACYGDTALPVERPRVIFYSKFGGASDSEF